MKNPELRRLSGLRGHELRSLGPAKSGRRSEAPGFPRSATVAEAERATRRQPRRTRTRARCVCGAHWPSFPHSGYQRQSPAGGGGGLGAQAPSVCPPRPTIPVGRTPPPRPSRIAVHVSMSGRRLLVGHSHTGTVLPVNAAPRPPGRGRRLRVLVRRGPVPVVPPSGGNAVCRFGLI